jgi:hypothetical protein
LKTLILEILLEAASEFPTLAARQSELETSIQVLKNPIDLKSNTETETRFKMF